jgi:hypothetical protein
LVHGELVNHLLNPGRFLGDPQGGGLLEFGGHGTRHDHGAVLGDDADIPRLEDRILEELGLDFSRDDLIVWP